MKCFLKGPFFSFRNDKTCNSIPGTLIQMSCHLKNLCENVDNPHFVKFQISVLYVTF